MARVEPSGRNSEDAGALPEVRYRLVSDGTTVTAYDQTGALVTSSTDGGAVLAAVLPAAAAAGATITFRNDGNAFPWGSVPAIPNGITSKLLIQGDGSLVRLSVAGARFLDVGRTADFQTFQHIEVTDFVIDATAAPSAFTHTIFGSRTGGVTPDQRISYLDIALRRIRCFGINTVNRSAISMGITQVAGGEGTQNSWKDIVLEDIAADGGQYGFFITGGPTTGVTNYNMLYDNVRIIRCKHTQSAATIVGSVGAAANLMVGQNAPGGYVLVRDFYGEYSGDVGIEIDNATYADLEDCVIANAKTAYFATNFAPPQNANAQTVAYRRCEARVTDATVNTACAGWNIIPNNTLTFGSVIYDSCTYLQNNNVAGTGTSANVWKFSGNPTIGRVTLRACRANIEAINWNNAANTDPFRIVQASGATIGLLDINGLDIRGAGTVSGAGSVLFRGIDFSTSGSMQIRCENIDVDWTITANGNLGATFIFDFSPTGSATLGGSIRRVRIVSLGSDTASKFIQCNSTANLTISPAPLTIEDCDFSAIITAGNEVILNATQAAAGAVLTRGNRWKTRPAPVALTGLVTATGKALGAQAASVFWRALVQLIQGSGAAITAVDYSTNGGTTYTNLLTQASSALPVGAGPNVGPLLPGDLLKATFTTTQPTVTLVPVDP